MTTLATVNKVGKRLRLCSYCAVRCPQEAQTLQEEVSFCPASFNLPGSWFLFLLSGLRTSSPDHLVPDRGHLEDFKGKVVGLIKDHDWWSVRQ